MRAIKTVSIIGVGLIGGSLGMALKSRKTVGKVIGIGRNTEKLQKALDLKAVDSITTDFKIGVQDADIVVICTPVGLIVPTLKNILPFVRTGCIITDVGSVKGPIVKDAGKLTAKQNVFFVGGHPMAGSEQAGINHARADLFVGATWALTPAKNTANSAIKKVGQIIRATGAWVINLKPARHDAIVAFTSHLPHLLAAALVHSIEKQLKKDRHTTEMTAGSFRDMTRIASSSPDIWKDIFLMNRKEIIGACATFHKITQKMLEALQKDDEKATYALFAEARILRDSMMHAHGKTYHTEAK